MSRERWLQSKRTADAKVLRWKVPGLYLRNSKEANRARQNEESREENSRKWSWRCSMGLDGSRLPTSVEMLGSPHGVRQGVIRGQGSDMTWLAMSRVSFTAALRAYWWGDKGESRESLQESSIHMKVAWTEWGQWEFCKFGQNYREKSAVTGKAVFHLT